MFSNHKPVQGKRFGPRFGLLVGLVLVTVCVAGSAGPVHASPAGPLAAAFTSDADFTPMSGAEMAKQRGGFDGVAFGIFLSGTLTQPVTQTLPPGLTVSTLSPNQVQIIGAIGSLGNTSGILQLTNIVGNFNVVNNNIIINVSIQPTSPTNAAGL